MSRQFPNDVVGVEIPLQIGEIPAKLTVQSFEPQFTTVSYKPNRVMVRASASAIDGELQFPGRFEFTISERTWKKLNRDVRENGGQA